jgi:hypothetical protein
LVNQKRLAGICARNVLYFGADRKREKEVGAVAATGECMEWCLQSRPEISGEDGSETRLSHAPTTGTDRALTSSQAHPMIDT